MPFPSVGPEGRIAFTDKVSRQVKELNQNGISQVIAGTGEESNKNRTGSYAAFGQPMGLCTEGSNMFVTDAQIDTIKLITTVSGTILFLENLGRFYSAFSVHLKNKPTPKHSLVEAHQMVKTVSSYVKSTVSAVQVALNSDCTTTVASKTVEFLQLVVTTCGRRSSQADCRCDRNQQRLHTQYQKIR